MHDHSNIRFNESEIYEYGGSIPVYERSEDEIINFIENNSSTSTNKKSRHSTSLKPYSKKSMISILINIPLVGNKTTNKKHDRSHFKKQRAKVCLDITKYEAKYI